MSVEKLNYRTGRASVLWRLAKSVVHRHPLPLFRVSSSRAISSLSGSFPFDRGTIRPSAFTTFVRLAEGEGFEPSKGVNPYTLSKRAH